MRLLRQISLYYQEGNSDKVYEVDLCEAGEGEFVVNYRYGRRGARLREGTKTVFPLERSKAEVVFDKLVAEKKAKGYRESEITGEPEEKVEGIAAGDELYNAGIEAALLARLRGEGKAHWPLSRVLWRIGELRVNSVWPEMRKLVGSLNRIEAYSFAWSVGRMRFQDASPELDQLAQRFCGTPDVLRMIQQARTMIGVGTDHLSSLPDAWRDSVKNGEIAELEQLLKETDPHEDRVSDLFDQLFIISADYPVVRKLLHGFIQQVDLRHGWFRIVRHLFKLAELRQDAELYGALAMRIEGGQSAGSGTYEYVEVHQHENKASTSNTHLGQISPIPNGGGSFNVHMGGGSNRGRTRGRWQYVKPRAFSSATKQYFRRRIVRTLERAAKDGDVSTYITFATGLLVNLSEETPRNIRQRVEEWKYDYQTRQMIKTVHFAPEFGQFYALTWLLMGGLPELEGSRQRLSWRYAGGRVPEFQGRRTEAHPELWDKSPDAALYLLKAAKHQLVIDFALRVWNANPAFEAVVEVNDLVELLGQAFPDVQQMALGMARSRWNPDRPDGNLLLALLGCGLEEARHLGCEWLRDSSLLDEAEFVAKLFVCNSGEQWEQVQLVLCATQSLPLESSLLILADWAMGGDVPLLSQAIQWLRAYHKDAFASLSIGQVESLLGSSVEANQMMACCAIVAKPSMLSELSDEQIMIPFESESLSVRAMGLEVLGLLGDKELAEHADLLASCIGSPDKAVRDAVMPIIGRLVTVDPDVGRELVENTYPLLLRDELCDGMHESILELLMKQMTSYLGVIPVGQFRDILRSKYAAAHELGFYLLKNETELAAEPLLQLCEWADHEHLELRLLILEYFRENEERLIYQLDDVISLSESEWPETREYFFELLRERVPEERWDADLLVGLCDCNDVEVSDLGREMITKRFSDTDGWTYLAKLSQHPTEELQLFATNFLERFAAGNAERIQNLDIYFRTVLGKVGAGRVAKERVYSFLESQGLADAQVRAQVVDLMLHHAATIAVGDRARCLQILVKLQEAGASVPFKVKKVATWNEKGVKNAI